MKTSRRQSLAAARTALDLSAFIRHRRWNLAALILVFGVAIQLCIPAARAESRIEKKNGGSQQWSLRVDQVDTGDVSPDPSLASTFHKNLLRELAKTKRFKQVILGSDRNTREVPDLLILKMTVQEDTPSSEPRRANLADAGVLGVVAEGFLRICGRSAVSGRNRLNARIRLYTPEGRLVLDNIVEGDLRLTGNHSRATHDLVHNVAGTLKRSTLPDTVMVAEQETASLSNAKGTRSPRRNAIMPPMPMLVSLFPY